MVNGQKYGPVDEQELAAWVAQGRVRYNDMVWTDSMAQWQPLGEVQHLFSQPLNIPPSQAIAPGPAVAQVQAAQMYPPDRSTAVLVWGILAIVISALGLIFGGIAWHMGNEELRRIDAGQANPANRGTVTAGKICGIIGFFLGLATCCFFTAYLGIIFSLIGSGAAHGF